MPDAKLIDVKSLNLDLENYRTVPQKNEEDAINAMIAIKPDRFFAVMNSIIEDDYLMTDNLIVLKKKGYVVKEGNRRTAALKLIHGIHAIDKFNVPSSIKEKIEKLDPEWKQRNKQIPCTIFELDEEDKASKIVNLAHAKNEKASRDPWSSVARARHNRDEKQGSEPALDLLEKYLEYGKNLTPAQKERWGGDYPLTVLEEAIRKIAPKLGYETSSELAKEYPKISIKNELEELLRDIGLKQLRFTEIRDKNNDFSKGYNLQGTEPVSHESISISNNEQTDKTENKPGEKLNTSLSKKNESANETSDSGNDLLGDKSKENFNIVINSSKAKSITTNSPKNITKLLSKFTPRGDKKQKIVALRDEMKILNIQKTPLAFCFLLRSIFELSAKLYCEENGISRKKDNGKYKELKDLLREINNDLVNKSTDDEIKKKLHGAATEISKSEGLLSVTSMNQLVHNPDFSIMPTDICILFNNIFPFLEAMNN